MGCYLEYIEIYFGNTIDLVEDRLPPIIGKDHAFIAAYYNFYLCRKLRTSKIRKLNVFLTTDPALDKEYYIDKISNIYLFLAPLELEGLKGHDLKRYLSQKIYAAFKFIGNKDDWELSLIDTLNNTLIETRFDFKDYYGKSVKRGDLLARIFFEVKDSIDLYIEITKGNHLSRMKFSSLGINSTFVAQLGAMLSKVDWISDDILRIHHVNKKDYWEISINDAIVNYYFDRAEKGDAYGEYNLGIMYLNGQTVLKNDVLGKEWIQKSAEQGYPKAINLLKKLI